MNQTLRMKHREAKTPLVKCPRCERHTNPIKWTDIDGTNPTYRCEFEDCGWKIKVNT
jgi:hypothetical protein